MAGKRAAPPTKSTHFRREIYLEISTQRFGLDPATSDISSLKSVDLVSCCGVPSFRNPPWRSPGGNPGANLKSISHRCHPIMVAFVWKLTQETINFPLGCLQMFGANRAHATAAVGYALPNLLPRIWTTYASVVLFFGFGAKLLKSAARLPLDVLRGFQLNRCSANLANLC